MVNQYPVTLMTIIGFPFKVLIWLLLLVLSGGRVNLWRGSIAPRRKLAQAGHGGERLKENFTVRREFRKQRWLDGHEGQINWLLFTADSQLLISGSNDKTVRVWRLSDQSQLRLLRGHDSPVLFGVLHPDNDRLATADEDGRLIVWRVLTGQRLWQVTAEGGFENLIGSRNGRFLAGCSPDGTIKVWDWDGQRVKLETSSAPG